MHGLFTNDIKTDLEAQQRVRDWIKALRSGRYEQGRNCLHLAGDGFCCLGVACDLFDNTRWLPMESDGNEGDEDGNEFVGYRTPWRLDAEAAEVAVLPDDVRDAYCLYTANGDYYHDDGVVDGLDSLNDQGVAFSDLADVIERELNDALS